SKAGSDNCGGNVQADAANSARAFKTDLRSDVDDLFEDCVVVFTSERGRKVEAYNAVAKIITVSSGFARRLPQGIVSYCQRQWTNYRSGSAIGECFSLTMNSIRDP